MTFFKFFSIIFYLSLCGLPLLHGQDTGCLEGNCISGKGIFAYHDGSLYNGHFKNGKAHGIGRLVNMNDESYIGDFFNGFQHGRGKYTWKNGDIYTGNFRYNVPQGEGKMIYTNGDIYMGSWVSGKPAGTGTYTYQNGTVYKGGFLDGHFSGNGEMTMPDGSKYVGAWLMHKKHGKGITSDRFGNMWSQLWDFDTLINEEIYLPTEENGVTLSTNPSKDDCDLNCNKMRCHEVCGTYTYKDGSTFKGTFVNGKGEGWGTCHYANGDVYTGFWSNHAPDGEGTIIYASGVKYAAVWQRGKPVKPIEMAVTKPAPKKNQTQPTSSKTDIHALIVGVATYNHMRSLKYTDDDAYRLYAFLKSPEGGALEDDHIHVLIDDAASHDAIIYQLKKLSQKVDEDDVLMVYLSGHGVDGAFVPYDFDGKSPLLRYADLLNIIDNSQAGYKVLLTDACHSGSLFAARSTLNEDINAFYESFHNIKKGTAIITSSKQEEVSLEYGNLRQGIFSHFLINGLKGDADKDNNNLITIAELYQYISKNVKTYTAEAQHPEIMGDYDPFMPVAFIRSE